MKLILTILLLAHCLGLLSKEIGGALICGGKITAPYDEVKLTLANCQFSRMLARDIEVESWHRGVVNEKLANLLSGQLAASIEDNLLTAQLYQENGANLLGKGSGGEIAQQCALSGIDKIVDNCKKKMNNSADFQNKINHLTNKMALRVKPTCTFPAAAINSASIGELLRREGVAVLGGNKWKEDECLNQKNPKSGKTSCPANNENIALQLDERSAAVLIERIIRTQKMPGKSDEAKKEKIIELDKVFVAYPALRLIMMAGGDFRQEFIDYLQGFKNNQGRSAKEYINDFIFKNKYNDVPNQDVMAKALEGSCRSLRKNIENYLCSEPLQGSNLATLDSNAADKLFSLDLNPKESPFKETELGTPDEAVYGAYAFYCLAKFEEAKGQLNRENSVDSFFKDYE